MDLKAIQHELKTQDNRITAHPIWIVYDKKDVSANIDYDNSKVKYLDGQSDYCKIADSYEELLKYAKKEAKECDLKLPTKDKLKFMDDEEFIEWMCKKNDLNWIKYPYQMINVFKTVCFTEKAANEYIQRERHHLNEPFTYVDSLYRNEEMIELRNALLEGKLEYKE
jgi:hypothetical protein